MEFKGILTWLASDFSLVTWENEHFGWKQSNTREIHDVDVFWRYIRRPLLLVAVERKCRGPQVDKGQLRHGRVLNMVHFACKGPCLAVDVAGVHASMLQCHLNESSVKKSSLSLSRKMLN